MKNPEGPPITPETYKREWLELSEISTENIKGDDLYILYRDAVELESMQKSWNLGIPSGIEQESGCTREEAVQIMHKMSVELYRHIGGIEEGEA